MPGITGMGDSFSLPNYVGELFAVSPEDTPFLSSIGGLTGGRPANATHFTWSGYDLRDASHTRQRREGADAPEAEGRARFSVMNVVEIHHESISTSYTKMAATQQFGNIGANNPNVQGVGGENAVTDEHGWQITQALKQISRDMEATFILGEYSDPDANSSSEGPRRTRGLLEAIDTNSIDADGDPLSEDLVLDLMQSVWENGGISETETATLMVGARQKRNLTRIFITEKGFQEQTRNVGGVNVQTIETDFGRVNVMLNRYMPSSQLVVTSLEQCAPRFMPIPGKGFLFQEELAKTGSSTQTQIYGEVGLEYGNEATHGKITDLSTGSGGGGGGGTQSVFITGSDSTLPVSVQNTPEVEIADQPIGVEVVDGLDGAGAQSMSATTEATEDAGHPRPSTTASRAAWEAYVLATYDVDTEETKGMTKAQIQKLDADLSADE